MTDKNTAGLTDQIIRDIRGSWRFRWHGMAAAWIACLLGWVGVLWLPDVYEARARVFVDTSSRLREVLGTIAFAPDIESRVNIVRQAILGRPQLEKVAAETGLVRDADTDEDRERLILQLMETIEVEEGRSSTDRNMFRIAYQHRDRDMAVAVVDTLLNTFVNDVIRQQERGADTARQFLREQIDHYADQLAAADTRLATFKRDNVGLLPGDGRDYFGSMQLELATLEQLRSDVRVAESRRDELRRQLSGEQPFVLPAAGSLSGATPLPGTVMSPALEVNMRLAELQRSLADLLLRFTDQHPDVIGLREQIAQLEEQQAGLSSSGALTANNPVYQSVQIALNQANVDIATLRARLADSETRVSDLRAMLDTMPQVEAELARLTRDYASTKSLYDQLVAQLERERLVDEGDERQVVNFQVVDPPIAGIEPVAPRRAIMLLAVLVLGIGAGGGLAYLLNLANPVFTDAAQLRKSIGLPVIGVVSHAASTRDRAMVRMNAVCYVSLLACLALLGGVIVAFRQPGVALVQQLVT